MPCFARVQVILGFDLSSSDFYLSLIAILVGSWTTKVTGYEGSF